MTYKHTGGSTVERDSLLYWFRNEPIIGLFFVVAMNARNVWIGRGGKDDWDPPVVRPKDELP